MSRQTWFITTPIYYPSDNLHIGHAYTTVAADALARYHRLRGEEVWFSTGTDEHGQKMERAARDQGLEPPALADRVVSGVKDLWATLHISYDDFVRTSEPRHAAVVQALFEQLKRQGDIYKGEYAGFYCEPDEALWLESRLVDGNCPDCGRPVTRVTEESYFFRMSRYQDRLLQHFRDHPDFVEPASRLHEMVNFVEQGLEDLSISRKDVRFGIPVPDDPEHSVYVWFDALLNYLTTAGYLSEPSRFSRTWPASVHLVGKEIVRFHAVIWPTILMALGLPLPDRVFGHGWLLLEDTKISKSLGNLIDPNALVGRYGVDAVRYYLLREVPFGADGIYSERALVERINVDLANDLGNLLHRTVAMVTQFNGGVVPPYRAGLEAPSLRRAAELAVAAVEEAMDRLELHRAIMAIQGLVRAANRYIEDRRPWALHRDPGAREFLDDVLYNLVEALRVTAILLSPFLVETPERILSVLGHDEAEVRWDATAWGATVPGSVVTATDPLFRRIDSHADEDLAEHPSPRGESPEPDAAAVSPSGISIDEFRRLDLRVALVRECVRVDNADRLLKLTLEVGEETRTVVSGIAAHYAPADLVGRSVVLVANLKPATIRQIRSEGMILAASDGDGSLSIVGPWSDIAAGSRVT